MPEQQTDESVVVAAWVEDIHVARTQADTLKALQEWGVKECKWISPENPG